MNDDVNYNEHFRNWIILVDKCNNEPEYQAIIYEKCKRDIVFFINNFIWTYDPRLPRFKAIPFLLYDFQAAALSDIEKAYQAEDWLLFEKSRDMGASYLFLAWILHKMLFTQDFSAGIGSRKEKLVDEKGNMKSLFERIRFMLNRLPDFLRGGYDDQKNSKHCLIKIPDTGSYVSGEAGDNLGRGDRTSIYLLDEAAFIDRSPSVIEALSNTTNCVFLLSTPNGRGNEFARLRWKTNITVITLHWKQHPKKDQIWYDKQCEKLTSEQVAQEIDISYAKSTLGRVYKWFDAAKHAVKLKYNKDWPLQITFDFGIGDPTSVLILQDYGAEIKILAHIEKKDMAFPEIMAEVRAELEKMGAHVNLIGGWYGDPDARNRDRLTGGSIKAWILSVYNITLRMIVPNVIQNRILAVRKLGRDNRIFVNENLTFLIECFENYKFPNSENTANDKPVHNKYSHAMTSIEYYCVYEYGFDTHQDNAQITTTSYR